MSNPYLEPIVELTKKILNNNPESLAKSVQKDIFVHWDSDNEWIYSTMAGFLFASVFSEKYGKGKNVKSDKAKQYILSLFQQLTEAAVDDRWYHLQDRKGDPNIDRFTMLPFLESFLGFESKLPLKLRNKVFEKIKSILNVQLNEYGKVKMADNPYPNMDIYYCLIMLLGSKITGEKKYYREFIKFLEILENAQFSGGAWTYINGTNECPVYHDINTILCGRIWELSHEEKALNMLKKSIPYYPQIISSSGLPEYYTDPWWKHGWDIQMPIAPDLVSSITGDQHNRWIGNKCRDDFLASFKSMNNQNMINSLPWVIYTAMSWKNIAEKELPVNVIYHDENIEGPRGKFNEWNWAATARYGSDTVVGAMDNSESQDSLSFLSGITPEINYHPDKEFKQTGLRRLNLAMIPPKTKGITSIEKDHCKFEVSYQMACLRSIWDQQAFPFLWQCRQTWRMDKHSLIGKIEIISNKNQESPPPRVRIRWGKNQELQKISENTFKYGSFLLKILQSDFSRQTIKSAPVCCYLTVKDGTELILELEKESGKYKNNETFSLQLEIHKS